MPARHSFADLKKDGPFFGALLFFVVSLGHDLLTRTFTASTAIFGLCVLVGIFQPALEHVVNRKREASARRATLTCTASHLAYVDESGVKQEVSWDDVEKVTWSEPDWGYLGSEPYWTIWWKDRGFDIEGAWDTAAKDAFPQLLASRLPGFDAAVVEKARAAGFFNTNSLETLTCWTRPTPALATPTQ